ncbi:MAG TPA: hypothetical protein VF158_07380 [Longimicrobiales bacterium]
MSERPWPGGPGEFEATAAVRVGRGDTLHVFDNMTLRWGEGDPAEGRLVPLPAQGSEPDPPSAVDPPRPARAAAPGVRQDREGRLWVMVLVAGKEWRKEVVAGGSGHGGSGHGGRVVDWNAYHDTVIEAIDPETGRLLQTTRLPLAFNAFVDDDLISTVVLDEADVPHLTVWRVRLLQ